jgi:hypothetical protein
MLTQVWCKTNALENSSGEQTSAEQFEAGAAIHLPLEGFQPVEALPLQRKAAGKKGL